MAIHFAPEEYESRKRILLSAMTERGVEGLLLFRQESMYWLSGYDSLGYVFFQALYLRDDGRMTLFSRPQDLAQAKHTSIISDIVLWRDRADFSPAEGLKEVLRARAAPGASIGVEWNTCSLSVAKARAVEAALDGTYRLHDASDLVDQLRAIKSPPEIEVMRAAAELADQAYSELAAQITPGRSDGELLATLHGSIFRNGGGYPANECILSSGQESILLRHHAGRRMIGENDPLFIEFAAPRKRYHAALLRTLIAGRPTNKLANMHRVCIEALGDTQEVIKPGLNLGDLFDFQAAIFDRAGYSENRLHSCGYGLGATFPPTWVDWPFIQTGSQVEVRPGMTLLLLMILLDRADSFAVGVGHTVLVTANGCEPLSKAPLDLNLQ